MKEELVMLRDLAKLTKIICTVIDKFLLSCPGYSFPNYLTIQTPFPENHPTTQTSFPEFLQLFYELSHAT
jgi:hypothetical protein